MTQAQNVSDVQCSSQKTQTIGEGKNVAENDVQSCSQLKRGSEPAFPGVTYVSQDGKKNPEGMTIRDVFAAAALPVAWKAYESFAAVGDNANQELAKAAYQIADAMLKAREAK